MQDDVTNQAIAEVMHMQLVDTEGATTPIEASFEFDPGDPYAITILLMDGTAPVRWTFARDLLIDGYYEPSGDGDVHVFPCLDSGGRAVVIFDFESPVGGALIQVGSRAAAWFIDQMLAVVPRGAEGDLLDLDAELAEMLADESGDGSPDRLRRR